MSTPSPSRPSPTSRTSAPSPTILGPFRLLRPLGQGGLGRVFEALSYGASGFERRVAIKLLVDEAHAEPDLLRVLIAEGKNAGQLRHQNLVSVEQLEVADGQYFVVMELIDGADLAQLLEAAGPLPPPLVAAVGAGVARGLAYLHGQLPNLGGPDGSDQRPALIHRDVSPSNILLSNAGEVKLTDFGIAKPLGRADESSAHSLKGKLAYMSPEQARGDRLTPASDVFSLGCTLVELATGAQPHEGKSAADTLERIKQAKCPDLSSLDQPLAALLADCLEPAAQDRPEALQLMEALMALVPPAASRELAAYLSTTAAR